MEHRGVMGTFLELEKVYFSLRLVEKGFLTDLYYNSKVGAYEIRSKNGKHIYWTWSYSDES